MAPLSLRVLGEPLVTRGGATLRFATRKTLALLLYLAIERRPVSREALVTLLWPESDTVSGRAALRNTLTYLRRTLAGHVEAHLLIERERLAFVPSGDSRVDAHLLDAAATGLRAPPLRRHVTSGKFGPRRSP